MVAIDTVVFCVITVGAMLSITVTVDVAVPTFPFASVTVNVTVLAPRFVPLKVSGEAVIVAIPQLSDEPLFIAAVVVEPCPFVPK
ncbi:hypothetical protein D3C72_613270 [compost metagenome]